MSAYTTTPETAQKNAEASAQTLANKQGRPYAVIALQPGPTQISYEVIPFEKWDRVTYQAKYFSASVVHLATPDGACPGCGKVISLKARNKPYLLESGRQITGVYECNHCRAVLGECYLGESFSVVLPFMSSRADMAGAVYYDLRTLGSDGIGRRHGWFDPADRKVLQLG